MPYESAIATSDMPKSINESAPAPVVSKLCTLSYMEIETVLVSPGMAPPTIRITPNSPRVWANVSTAALVMPRQANGSSIRRKICHLDKPLTSAASRISGLIASKARCIGCMAKGKLTMSEATRIPVKENTSGKPKIVFPPRPTRR